jgi:AcrR family transcriptional regulator
MARKRPEGRLAALAEAALQQFSQRGCRLTQVADVANELGLSPGTVYGSVTSKEALFDLAVRAAFDEAMPETGSNEPFSEPPLEALVERVNRMMRARMQTPEMGRASKRTSAPADVHSEFETLVLEQYDVVARNGRAIHPLDRCAPDWPALAELYVKRARRGLFQRWTRYIAQRIEMRALPPVPDAAIAWQIRTGDLDADPPPPGHMAFQATPILVEGRLILLAVGLWRHVSGKTGPRYFHLDCFDSTAAITCLRWIRIGCGANEECPPIRSA